MWGWNKYISEYGSDISQHVDVAFNLQVLIWEYNYKENNSENSDNKKP